MIKKAKKLIAYMGWLGHRNIGDEACFYAIRNMLPDYCEVVQWDIDSWDWSIKPDLFIVGGGTLLDINYDVRGRSIARMLAMDVPTIFWGTGVLQHTGKVSKDVLFILNSAKFVGVRGPFSKGVLNASGFANVNMIGDPALLLSESTNKPLGLKSNKIAINVGDARKKLLGSEDYIVEHMHKLINVLLKQNFEVILFPMWVDDNKYINKLAKKVSSPKLIIRDWNESCQSLIDFFSTCRCVIGMKLHSIVLSAAANVPFISISYRDKCLDFAASLNLDSWVIPANDAQLAEKSRTLVNLVSTYYTDITERFVSYKQRYRLEHSKVQVLVQELLA